MSYTVLFVGHCVVLIFHFLFFISFLIASWGCVVCTSCYEKINIHILSDVMFSGMPHSVGRKAQAQHPNTLDLSPCDFLVFYPFEKTLKRHRFQSDENVRVVVMH